ncbi:hypothetical protein [Amycolatopsis jejuensis]|uniref:hypothetical protein n=1 Tax=Amycolatopsis jejuensis TaxID=330084 RepID=UPI000525EE40|nr:hypothetical protein [Amycolatopsis jejuensis]
MGSRSDQLSASEAEYEVHRSADGRNHRYERRQFLPGVQVFWPKCTRGKAMPQRIAFHGELSTELGENRDRSADCRPCFSAIPHAAVQTAW